jgi:hypothetical protein
VASSGKLSSSQATAAGERLPCSERLGASARLLDRQLARVGGDVVEDLPERGLDLVLGVGGDLARRSRAPCTSQRCRSDCEDGAA